MLNTIAMAPNFRSRKFLFKMEIGIDDMYICVYVCVCARACMRVCVHTCVRECVRACVRVTGLRKPVLSTCKMCSIHRIGDTCHNIQVYFAKIRSFSGLVTHTHARTHRQTDRHTYIHHGEVIHQRC